MAKSFQQLTDEAMAEVDGISAEQAQHLLKKNSNALLIDVRDAADISPTGVPAGGVNISLGMLPIRADRELPEDWRDIRLQDRSLPIITTCFAGMMSAIGAKLLKDMGFTNVRYMEGGMEAWNDAGLSND